MNQDTVFPEIARLQYLQLLGITSYYPRFVLAGAAPSSACAWPEPAAQETAQRQAVPPPVDAVARAPAPAAMPATAPSRGRVLVPERQRPAPAPSDSATTEPQSESGPTQDGASAVQLHLVLLRAGESLALCCQLPLLARSGLAPRQQQLLDNILRWLGVGAALREHRVFKWPLPGLIQTATDAGTAGLGLGHFFEQAAYEQPFSELLLFGQQIADSLDHAPRREAVAPWQVTSTHSLDELLSQPLLKRDTWQALLPLQARLSRV